MSPVIKIQHPHLRAILQHKVFRRKGIVVTQSDMEHMTSLVIPYSPSLDDISVVKDAINLEYVRINGTAVTDISPLACASNIEYLDLYNNLIKDISPLSKLLKLRCLLLDGNQISDILALQELPRLRNLDLEHNQISDISALPAICPHLLHLWISSNNIKDFSPIAYLPRLRSLSFDNNPISKNTANQLATYIEILNAARKDVGPLLTAAESKILYEIASPTCTSTGKYIDQLLEVSPNYIFSVAQFLPINTLYEHLKNQLVCKNVSRSFVVNSSRLFKSQYDYCNFLGEFGSTKAKGIGMELYFSKDKVS